MYLIKETYIRGRVDDGDVQTILEGATSAQNES